jgi:hypothetical protein
MELPDADIPAKAHETEPDIEENLALLPLMGASENGTEDTSFTDLHGSVSSARPFPLVQHDAGANGLENRITPPIWYPQATVLVADIHGTHVQTKSCLVMHLPPPRTLTFLLLAFLQVLRTGALHENLRQSLHSCTHCITQWTIWRRNSQSTRPSRRAMPMWP